MKIIRLAEHMPAVSNGMYLRITACPGAKREEVVKEKESAWRISVREPAEQNRANERVRTLIACELSVPVSSVRILTGHHARTKMISVET